MAHVKSIKNIIFQEIEYQTCNCIKWYISLCEYHIFIDTPFLKNNIEFEYHRKLQRVLFETY